MRVGIAVITRDRGRELPTALARLVALPESPPIVLVDNGSTDGTPDEVEGRFPAVRVLRAGRNLGAAGRNLAVQALDTPYVAFSDDDSWWEPGALENAADILDRYPRLGLVAARILVGPEGMEDETTAEMARSPLGTLDGSPWPAVVGFVACGAVVRRSAFLEAGGFHPRFALGGEERLLAADLRAAGWQIAYVPGIVARHHPSEGGRADRSECMIRNDLWFAWLRRPRGVALRSTARALIRATRDADWRAGLGSALGGLPWILRERRPVGRELERELRLTS
jgi:GT2 family glycosyltransferase